MKTPLPDRVQMNILYFDIAGFDKQLWKIFNKDLQVITFYHKVASGN